MELVVVDGALPAGFFEELMSDGVQAHATVYADAALEVIETHSYWYDLERSPRVVPEQAAQLLAQYLPDRSRVKGVEWWVNGLDPTAGMIWHFDVDRGATAPRFARYASILYLNSNGAPTVVVDQQMGTEPTLLVPPTPREGFAVPPLPNRFAAFDGRLRHCVAALADAAASRTKRYTLLLNWWDDKPGGPCVPFPYEEAHAHHLRVDGCPTYDAAFGKPAHPIPLSGSEILGFDGRSDVPVWPT